MEQFLGVGWRVTSHQEEAEEAEEEEEEEEVEEDIGC